MGRGLLMNKAMMWVSILAVSVMLVACQSKEVEQEETVTAQQEIESHTDNEEDGHSHAHNEEDGHNHAHDEEEVHNHSHDEEDGHSHAQDEEAKQIYAGYFEDSQIEDRELTDWAGDWQSVYPYLLDGTLDEVFDHKAEHSDSMNAEEYKQYYDIGYKTTVDRIVIEDGQVTFYEGDQVNTGEYVSDGYEVLTYEKGNRGVRYIFKLVEPTEGVPTYIQFSDHSISPTDAGHYHLYWGDDRAALLEEVVNWPTYYPSSMDGHTIAHEMMAH